MRIQTAKLDEFMHNVNANQQTFHNSVVEKNEALKQSLTHTLQSTIEQTELAVLFSAFRAATEDRHRETKAEFDRLSLAIDRQYDRMREVVRNAYESQEPRMEYTQEVAEAHAESLAQNACEIAWAKRSRAGDRQNALALLPSVTPVATRHTWTIEECGSLEQTADSRGTPQRMLEPVYLRGYCVSVGIVSHSHGNIHLLFELRKGIIDQYLEWPFNYELHFSILHAQEAEKLEYCVIPSRRAHLKNHLSPSNKTVTLRTSSMAFIMSELEAYGFIKDGRMLLSLALEPMRAEEP